MNLKVEVLILGEIEKKNIITDLMKYYKSIPNIDRACSSVIENSIAIFLPLTRIDKSKIYEEFMENNQILEIDNDLFDKVEIRGRLLGQIHKDILEALLTTTKTFSEDTAQFKIETTAYKLLQKMKRHTGDKKWLLQKLDEIAECRIKLHYKNASGKDESFNFSFIGSIRTVDHKNIAINFSPEYTYFMAHNELLDYSEYVPQIITLRTELKKIQRELSLKTELNHHFIKAVVRYMLVHTDKSKGTNRKIETFVRELNLKKVMSEEEISDCLIDLRREKVIDLLNRLFGITLISDNKTINFKGTEQRSRYHLRSKLDLK